VSMSELQKQLTSDPLDDSDLKAERVQEERVMVPSEVQEPTEMVIHSRLKAERVQERLRAMPGWSLRVGGHAIDRVRDLPSAFGAADYGTLVLREAARTRQKVRIGISGPRVVITVLASRESSEIGLEQLDFAAGLL
jgi:hypothetical protein